jgi:uroporphyrinogen-III decarboxylase
LKERWIEMAADADEKQEAFFDRAMSGEGIPFENEEAKAAFQERRNLIKDAVQMKKVPKRIPICPQAGSFPLEYAGVTWKEAMYNYETIFTAYEKYQRDFASDTANNGGEIVSGKTLEILGLKLGLWAGQGLPDDKGYQYVEEVFLKADEYQDLIDDPTGWFLNVYFPRIFGGLEGFSDFPIAPLIHEIPVIPVLTIPFAVAPLASSVERLLEASKDSLAWSKVIDRIVTSLMGKGYPVLEGGFTKAPFDVLGDTLRGTKEIMMDLFRRPGEVLEACERLTPIMIKAGVKLCVESNNPVCFIPLHKGADGFISDEQFRTFYWPTLRKLVIGLINQGVVPMLFAEGGYNSRLQIISDLPRGRVIWSFDRTDMKRAKETVGKNACIMGNVPVSLLHAGTPDAIKEYCRGLIDVAGKNGGYIFSTGAGMESSNPENVKAMIDFAKAYGVYR